jgi:hypothetical protein
MNAGLPGANTGDEYHFFLELEPIVQPDIVVVGMHLNDAQSSEKFYARRLSFPFAQSRLIGFLAGRFDLLSRTRSWNAVHGQEINDDWKEQFANGRTLSPGKMFLTQDAFDSEVYNASRDFGLARNSTAWDNLEKIVQSFRDSVELHGAKFKVVLFPIHAQVFAHPEIRFNGPQQPFQRLCSRLGLACLDLLPRFRRLVQGRDDVKTFFYDHCHMTPVRKEFVGREIAAWLTAQN